MTKYLLGLLLALAPAAHAANIIPAEQVVFVVGGSDPTKLPLAGGTMSGSIVMGSSGVEISTYGVIVTSAPLTDTALQIQGIAGDLGAFAFALVAVDSSPIAIVFSTSAVLDPSNIAGLIFQPAAGKLQLSRSSTGGSLDLEDAQAKLEMPGGGSVVVQGNDVTVNGTTVELGATTINLNAPTINVSGVPTGSALCLNASGILHECNSAVSVTGTCTCP